MKDVNETYTQDEVMGLLKISRPTLYRWRRDGKIKYVSFGKQLVRYPKTEVARLLKEGLMEYEA